MRENLFRGKRKDTGEWVQGDLVHSQYKLGDTCVGQYGNTVGIHQVDPETVGQYTGLTDKNGKKIFEGDIVHYLYQPGEGYWNSDQNSVIEWVSIGFYMRGIFGTNKYACTHGFLSDIPIGRGEFFEVIGNIHDNPELLEVTE